MIRECLQKEVDCQSDDNDDYDDDEEYSSKRLGFVYKYQTQQQQHQCLPLFLCCYFFNIQFLDHMAFGSARDESRARHVIVASRAPPPNAPPRTGVLWAALTLLLLVALLTMHCYTTQSVAAAPELDVEISRSQGPGRVRKLLDRTKSLIGYSEGPSGAIVGKKGQRKALLNVSFGNAALFSISLSQYTVHWCKSHSSKGGCL